MNDQIIQVEQLLDKKKYKKALLILQKINKKHPSFASISYTASCYFFNKKYAQANLYFIKALPLTLNNTQKIEVLSNLAITESKLNNLNKAIEYYIKLLDIDDSLSTACHRSSLCIIAGLQNNHKMVFEYAPKLLMLDEYAKTALYLLFQSNLLTNDNEKNLSLYFNKIIAEIPAFKSSDALNFFELILTSNNITYINKCLDILSTKFSHEKWFKKYVSRKGQKNEVPSPLIKLPKERVISCDSERVKLVNELITHNKLLGAKFHLNLRIFEDKGNFSIKVYNQENKTDKLIDIPHTCMPLLSDFHFKLDNKGKLLATPIEKPINPNAIGTMLLMQKIYNSCNKINHWKDTFPFIALQAFPLLLKKLVSAKPQSKKIECYNQLLENKKYDELVIKSFLGSRDFSFEQKELKKNGIITSKKIESGLLSVIDFLNHKTASNYYQSSDGSTSISGLADPITQELFVHYNNFDPLLTYLIYGFVDLSSPYIFSVPIELSLTNGQRIEVLGNTNIIKEDSIPDNIKHLREYLTQVYTQPNGGLQVDKIMIPGTNESHLLRDILTIMINSINQKDLNINDFSLQQEILHLEAQIISKNMNYWQGVQNILETIKVEGTTQNNFALKEVQLLINFFKSHYQKYSSKLGISMF